MTEEKPRFPREIAIGVARELCELLKPVRSRLIVAGSLLRRKTSVGDMEILFIPRRETRQVDMLSCESVSPAEEAVAQLLAAGAIQKRGLREGTFYWGPKNKLAPLRDGCPCRPVQRPTKTTGGIWQEKKF